MIFSGGDISPDQVVEPLKHHDVEIELEPVVKQGARGAINSVYCRNPDKNLIEISSYID
ncbi:VOC family protein [Zymomonas mobilis]|uniref:hypothetical protein n=1 Tax=Zymomonas mobilis TaxID=542 RepID=UPI0021C4423D|nr:hypothetical protein [Zymomonas mobilis]